MIKKAWMTAGLSAAVFSAGLFVGHESSVAAQTKRVFEIRTYTADEGQLNTLVKRMRDGEAKIFDKVGMKGILFSVAAEAPKSSNTFVYILAHESLDSAKQSWAKFREDPDWMRLRTSLPVQVKVESIFVNPLDFSQLK